MTTVDLGRLPRGQDGQLVIGNTGKSPLWKTVSGDATLTAGGVLTLSASFQNLLVAATAPAAFSVHKNGTNQTGVADSTDTLVTWSTELYDVGSYFTSNAWTPPAGKVTMTSAMYATPVGGAGAGGGYIRVYKNGSAYRRAIGSALGTLNSGQIKIDDIANGTDAYTIRFFSVNVGGTSTITGAATDTWFMGHWISA